MNDDSDRYDDSDQHICQNCGSACDCGSSGGDTLPDGYSDYCLSCSSCNDSVRAKVLEAQIEAHAMCLVGW